MKKYTIFKEISGRLEEELFQDILQERVFRLERIVSKGHATPEGQWYDQEQDEWVMVLKGRAGLRFEEGGETVTMEPGDYLLIPAHRRHRVEWTSEAEETIWLALHFERT